MSEHILLSYGDIALATALVGITLLISYHMRLRLEKTLLIAALRTVIQLSLIGLVLTWVFSQQQWYYVLAILTFITLAAAWAARNRVKKPYRGLQRDTIIAITVSGWTVALLGLVVVLRVEPWYAPRYAIPILGLILGNALTGISLSADYFINAIDKQRADIELNLSLSATPWEAVQPMAQEALRTGMMPTINSMMVVGMVSLPGMMTGQILAGADPVNAVRYQIITMFFICAGSSIGCMMILWLVFRRYFNRRAQLVFPD